MYAHIFVTQNDMPIDPKDDAFNPDSTVYYRHGKTLEFIYDNLHLYLIQFHLLVLTKFYPQKAIVKQKNLLKKGGEHAEEEEQAVQQEEKAPVQQDEVRS